MNEEELPFPKSFDDAPHVKGRGSDKQWIEENLAQLSHSQRKKVCNAYSKAYDEISRQNANLRLMAFVENCVGVSNGVVNAPPKMRV